MARVLLAGTPERLAPVAERLVADGFAVRCAVAGGGPVASGAQSVDASPDLPGGIVMALEGVAVVCWLLGDAAWSDPDLHDSKLETMLLRVVDTGVRGFVYELPSGFAAAPALASAGSKQVAHANETWHIPCEAISTEGFTDSQLAESVSAAVSRTLGI
ncbi:MAG: hypothetical protein JHC87_01015 [Thermoleophilaceae bacterium]|nr:hypothetical protein [Thermoleophilaceae bacterium]